MEANNGFSKDVQDIIDKYKLCQQVDEAETNGLWSEILKKS